MNEIWIIDDEESIRTICTSALEDLFKIDDENVQIPGWDIYKVDYYNYGYIDNDKLPYEGFYLDIYIKRQSSYYLFKIIF